MAAIKFSGDVSAVLWLVIIFYCCTSFLAAGAKPKLPPGVDADSLQLLRDVAARPELMNLNYLECLIGLPQNPQRAGAGQAQSWYWYGDSNDLKYELHQQQLRPGQVSSSDFVFHLPEPGVSVEQLEHLFGKAHRRMFNSQCQPVHMYFTGPNSAVSFTASQGKFGVKEARVSYRGPGLAMPPPQDMKYADNRLREKLSAAGGQGKWREALPLAMVLVNCHPEDPEGHYYLGKCLAAAGDANQAIGQYKQALALIPAIPAAAQASGQMYGVAEGVPAAASWGAYVSARMNDDLRNKCIAGLQDLKFIDPSPQNPGNQSTNGGRKIWLVHRGKAKPVPDYSAGAAAQQYMSMPQPAAAMNQYPGM